MEKIRIITDSSSDIVSPQNNITVLPMTVRFGNTDYMDGIDINHKEFYEKLIESDELPTTSLISPAAFEDAYKNAVNEGESVIVITLSGKLSGTYQSAVVAAADYEDRVFVIDSLNASIGEQILIYRALKLIEDGLSVKEVVEILLEEREKIHTIALLDTLEYLKKGGRISKSVAFVGGALSIKPVASIEKGEVKMLGTARGSKNGNNFLMKEIEKTGGIDFSKPLRLGYTGLNDALLKKYIDDSSAVWKDNADSLIISPIGAMVGTHIGPGAIAVSFFAK